MKKILIIVLSLLASVYFIIAIAADDKKYSSSPSSQTTLIIKSQPIVVNGKKADSYRVEQPDGTWGYHGIKGQYFDTLVKNQTNEPVVLHWHGLLVPNDQDGVPYVTQPPILPGKEYHYRFQLKQAGTYWLHSHHGLQIQQQLAAPFIITDPNEKQKEKEVVIFLSDFSYKNPQIIFDELRKGMMNHQHDSAMDISSPDKKSMTMPAAPDLNDVNYDAYLTNYRTLQNPEVVPVQPGETIRLRVINGSAASNFFVNTGKLKGDAIAVDGESIQPLSGSSFQLATGQRIDIRVALPKEEDAYPILAQGEGTTMQTGLILTTPKAKIPTVPEKVTAAARALDYSQELSLKATHPLPSMIPGQTLNVVLDGDMMSYKWQINKRSWPNILPLIVKQNKRVEMVFLNQTGMAHPMHLHGHVFEVTEINGKPVEKGALRDTILVLPHTTVKVQFDTDNPGNWMMHCHMLYHQESGMMTLMSYEGSKIPNLTAH